MIKELILLVLSLFLSDAIAAHGKGGSNTCHTKNGPVMLDFAHLPASDLSEFKKPTGIILSSTIVSEKYGYDFIQDNEMVEIMTSVKKRLKLIGKRSRRLSENLTEALSKLSFFKTNVAMPFPFRAFYLTPECQENNTHAFMVFDGGDVMINISSWNQLSFIEQEAGVMHEALRYVQNIYKSFGGEDELQRVTLKIILNKLKDLDSDSFFKRTLADTQFKSPEYQKTCIEKQLGKEFLGKVFNLKNDESEQKLLLMAMENLSQVIQGFCEKIDEHDFKKAQNKIIQASQLAKELALGYYKILFSSLKDKNPVDIYILALGPSQGYQNLITAELNKVLALASTSEQQKSRTVSELVDRMLWSKGTALNQLIYPEKYGFSEEWQKHNEEKALEGLHFLLQTKE